MMDPSTDSMDYRNYRYVAAVTLDQTLIDVIVV